MTIAPKPNRRYAVEIAGMVGPPPNEPGQASALAYHRRLVAALRDWPKGFDPDLKHAIMKRERQYRRRAAGEDARWNVLGPQAGRTPDWIYPGDPTYAAPVTDDDGKA